MLLFTPVSIVWAYTHFCFSTRQHPLPASSRSGLQPEAEALLPSFPNGRLNFQRLKCSVLAEDFGASPWHVDTGQNVYAALEFRLGAVEMSLFRHEAWGGWSWMWDGAACMCQDGVCVGWWKNSCEVFGDLVGRNTPKWELLSSSGNTRDVFQAALCTTEDAVSVVHSQWPGVLKFPLVVLRYSS